MIYFEINTTTKAYGEIWNGQYIHREHVNLLFSESVISRLLICAP